MPNGKKVYGLAFLIGSRMLVGLFSSNGVPDGFSNNGVPDGFSNNGVPDSLSLVSNDFPDFLFLIGLTRLADGLFVSGGSECK